MGVRWGRGAAAFVLAAAATALVAGTAGADRADRQDDMAAARQATARYHQLEVAKAAGYDQLFDLDGITCIEDPDGTGAMGIHFVKGSLVGDGAVNATQPEVLLYELTPSGYRLVGVEYVVLQEQWGADRPAPELFGHQFHLIGSPNRYGLPPFYELHAWIWQPNRLGLFNDWNPDVSC